MKLNHRIAPLMLAAMILIAAGGCRNQSEVRTCRGSVWATTYSITYTSPHQLDDSILAVMKQVEHSLSPFSPDSRISAINTNKTSLTDSLLRRIFLTSIEINRLSHGAFDPTLAPLINLWGFGYSKSDSPAEPSPAAIDSALQSVGITRCQLIGDSLVKPNPATEFNFSAITKGYGCDLIGEMFRRNGVDNYMIEIGGEIALSGKNPTGNDWRIQIDDPTMENGASGAHSRLAVIQLSDCGIATSGNYRNFHNTDGRRTWHTIDATTGRPAITPTLSATVIAPDCMTADALATACMAMAPDSAMAMIGRVPEASVMLVVGANPANNTDTTLRVLRSPGFPTPL